MAKTKQTVRCVHKAAGGGGDPPCSPPMGSVVDTKLLSETVTVRFLQFSDNMPRVNGVEVFSPEFMCLERRWKVRIERHALAHVWLGAHLCSCEEVRHSTDLIPFSLKVRTTNNRHYEQTGKFVLSAMPQVARSSMQEWR